MPWPAWRRDRQVLLTGATRGIVVLAPLHKVARPCAADFVTAAVFVGYLARTDLWWIYLLQFLRGVSEVAMAPIGRALLAKHVPPKGRGTVMGMYVTTQTLARSGTGIIGGGLVDTLGFRALFAICAISSLASGLVAFFGLRHTAN